MNLFDIAAAVVSSVLSYRPEYHDHLGRYFNLVNAVIPNRKVGDVMLMRDNCGRRVVVVVTPVGNVVACESGGVPAREGITCFTPEILRGICGKGCLSDDQFALVVGLWGQENIGVVLEKVISIAGELSSN